MEMGKLKKIKKKVKPGGGGGGLIDTLSNCFVATLVQSMVLNGNPRE